MTLEKQNKTKKIKKIKKNKMIIDLYEKTPQSISSYNLAIKTYFDNFSNFKLAKIKQKELVSAGVNGTVYKVPFVKNKLSMYVALKFIDIYNGNISTADNLYYEYYVGKKFINLYLNKFPCFVETYGIYTKYVGLKNKKRYELHGIPTKLNENLDSSWNESCLQYRRIEITTQYFDNLIDFNSFLNLNPSILELFSLLYQTYYPLNCLGDKYTHYDLHLSNVHLYNPYNKPIFYRYHKTKKNKIITLKSKYVVKILDYGRNYFNNGTTNSNDIITNHIKNAPFCNSNGGYNVCGFLNGYYLIQGNACFKNRIDPDYIYINKPNMSSDLLLLQQVSEFYEDFPFEIEYLKMHGTIENMTNPKNVVTNIFNLLDILEEYLLSLDEYKDLENEMDDVHVILDIYDDGRDYTITEYNNKK